MILHPKLNSFQEKDKAGKEEMHSNSDHVQGSKFREKREKNQTNENCALRAGYNA